MLPEEVTRSIGKAEDVRILEVEKGAIRRYADALDDPNPLYRDEEYARNSKYGSIIAPPGFFGWPTRWQRGSTFPAFPETTVELIIALAKSGYSQIIDGSIEYEFFYPIKAGDTLSASSAIKDISERKDNAGKAVFVIVDTNYTNQNNESVAKVRQIFVNRQPASNSREGIND